MNIYLLRHGETSWNQDQRLQGLRDVPLNRAGFRQSRRLAAWYRKTGVRRIVSSPLLRARCTAQILAKCFGRTLLTDDRLREIDHGPWTGLRLAAIANHFPEDFATWSFSSEKLRLSNSESLAAVYRRCTAVLLDLIRDSCDEDVLVVSHGVVNALLLCAVMGAGLSQIREYSPPNAAVSALKVQRRKIVAVERELHATAE
jgi:broad specificity phosphatase PhoE